jgi:hypothetical protein
LLWTFATSLAGYIINTINLRDTTRYEWFISNVVIARYDRNDIWGLHFILLGTEIELISSAIAGLCLLLLLGLYGTQSMSKLPVSIRD